MLSIKESFGDPRNLIALVSGVAFLVLFMLVGLALDSIRASRAPGKLVAALDAAALGGAKLLDQGRAKDAEVSSHTRALFAARVSAMQLEGFKLRDIVVRMNRSRSSVTVTAHGTVTPIFGRALSLSSPRFRQTSRMAYRAAERPHRVVAGPKRKKSAKLLASAQLLESGSGRVAAFYAAAKDVTSPSSSAQSPAASTAAAASVAQLGAFSDHETAATSGSEPESGAVVRACAEPKPWPTHRVRTLPAPLQLVGQSRDCPLTMKQPPTSTTMQRDARVAGPAAPEGLTPRQVTGPRALYGFPALI